MQSKSVIKSITIENFKGIGAPVTIPLRSITLLFGANSTGKSTVLQAFHYLREVLVNHNPDPDKVEMGGDVIDLGGFANLVHNHDLTKAIRIRLEIAFDEDDMRPYSQRYTIIHNEEGQEIITFQDEEMDDLDNQVENPEKVESAWVEIVTCFKDKKPCIAEYSVGFNDKSAGTISEIFGVPNIVSLNIRHPLFTDEAKEYSGFDAFRELNIDSKSINKDDSQNIVASEANSMKPIAIPLPSISRVIPDFGKPLEFRTQDEPFLALSHEMRILNLYRFTSRIFVRPGEKILKLLNKSRYIGPIRSIPPRTYSPSKSYEESRWSDGMGAWDIIGTGTDEAHDVELSIVEKTSDYISKTLNLGYTLSAQRNYLLPIRGKIMLDLIQLALFNDEWDKPEIRKKIIDPIEALPQETRIQLHDLKRGINVSPADIGVGVSQIIPVVVGAVDTRAKMLHVEQPELHVHPEVVCNLGDIFIQEFVGSKRFCLLETHSEHLVLRIMRRMRETLTGKLPEGMPQIQPSDVAVLYVETYKNETIIREMPLNENGELVKAWPGGFFEEALRETF